MLWAYIVCFADFSQMMLDRLRKGACRIFQSQFELRLRCISFSNFWRYILDKVDAMRHPSCRPFVAVMAIYLLYPTDHIIVKFPAYTQSNYFLILRSCHNLTGRTLWFAFWRSIRTMCVSDPFSITCFRKTKLSVLDPPKELELLYISDLIPNSIF